MRWITRGPGKNGTARRCCMTCAPPAVRLSYLARYRYRLVVGRRRTLYGQHHDMTAWRRALPQAFTFTAPSSLTPHISLSLCLKVAHHSTAGQKFTRLLPTWWTLYLRASLYTKFLNMQHIYTTMHFFQLYITLFQNTPRCWRRQLTACISLSPGELHPLLPQNCAWAHSSIIEAEGRKMPSGGFPHHAVLKQAEGGKEEGNRTAMIYTPATRLYQAKHEGGGKCTIYFTARAHLPPS